MLLAAGQAYTQLNRYVDATESYRMVHALAPSNVVPLNNLAWLLQKSEPDEALRHAERANQLAPGAPWILDTLGWLLLERGEAAKAAGLFAEAAEKAPENPQYRYHLAQALGRTDQQGQATQILEELLRDERLARDRK